MNAFLRKFASYKFPENKNENVGLSLKYDFPEFAVKKLVAKYGKEKAIKIMDAPSEKTCVRFNNVNGKEYLDSNGFKYEETPYDNAFFVDKFTRNSDYDKGLYTFQSIGSIAICDAVSEGYRLLDACSAPGGKAVLLSNKFKNVVAQELHTHRAKLIEEYVNRMGVKNVSVVEGDATCLNKEFVDGFDAVLCDVPCSGFGVIKSNPDIKLNKTEDDIVNLTGIQLKIIKNCSRYVKKGGVLFYSTCTLFDEENDNVISAFLKGNDMFVPEVISPKIPFVKTEFGVQFTPDISLGAGFYISAFRRVL